jgi:hypothetical protein
MGTSGVVFYDVGAEYGKPTVNVYTNLKLFFKKKMRTRKVYPKFTLVHKENLCAVSEWMECALFKRRLLSIQKYALDEKLLYIEDLESKNSSGKYTRLARCVAEEKSMVANQQRDMDEHIRVSDRAIQRKSALEARTRYMEHMQQRRFENTHAMLASVDYMSIQTFSSRDLNPMRPFTMTSIMYVPV